MNYDVIVVGAGASGLSAAISAARCGARVLVLEKLKKAGTKLYATGNGNANVSNTHMDAASCFASCGKDASAFLGELFGSKRADEQVRAFLATLGVSLVDRNGYLYPASRQASTVVWSLLDEARRLSVEIKTGCSVTSVRREDEGNRAIYKAGTEAGDIYCGTRLILACGGAAAPKLGGSKIGYSLAHTLGHSVNEPSPALCPLIVRDTDYFSVLKGVRARALATAYDRDGNVLRSEEGEVQFTDLGLSGIVIFNMSYPVPDRISLDLLQGISALTNMVSLRKQFSGRTLIALLNGYMNDKLSEYIVRNCGYERNTGVSDVEDRELAGLFETARHLTFEITKADGFDHAQVTAGGVLLSEINPSTMESLVSPGLFITGELLDVHGICGGYNLTSAFLSGIAAGCAAGGGI